MRSGNFNQETIRTLCANVGGRCSNPNCRKTTTWPDSNGISFDTIGEAAHISAASEGGPRYNPNMSEAERKHISNGIWLCRNCHGLIDKDSKCYSVKLLQKWKADAEYEQYCATSGINVNKFTQNSDKKQHLQKLSTGVTNLHDLLKRALEYYRANLERFESMVDSEISDRYILYKDSLNYIREEFNTSRNNIGNLMENYSLEYEDELSNLINQYNFLLTFHTHSDCCGTIDYWSNFFKTILATNDERENLYQSIKNVITTKYSAL